MESSEEKNAESSADSSKDETTILSNTTSQPEETLQTLPDNVEKPKTETLNTDSTADETNKEVKVSDSNDTDKKDISIEKSKARESRELKLLIAAAKESNLDTNIAHKRNSMPETSNKQINSPAEIQSSVTLKRNMRSQNPEFVAKHHKFISKVTSELQYDSTVDDDAQSENSSKKEKNPNKRKRENSNPLIGSSGEELKKIKKPLFPPVPVKPGKDSFCWRCHREGPALSCLVCPRSFHVRCLRSSSNVKADNWTCPECEAVMKAENTSTRSPAMKRLSQDKLGQVLRYSLKRMKELVGTEPFLNPVDTKTLTDYKQYVVQPMDLSQMQDNIRENMYGSTDAFLTDAKWILHNSIIYNSSQSKLTTVAKSIVKSCKNEMAEIETCPECYINANTKKDTWFTEACSKPHLLVWAKLKGFPYWPAKAMRTNSEGLVDTRFFGAHDKAWVPVKDVFLYSKKDPNTTNKTQKNNIAEAIKEVDKHIEKLTEKFSVFKHAPYRMPYDPNVEKQQLKMMLPQYKSKEEQIKSPVHRISISSPKISVKKIMHTTADSPKIPHTTADSPKIVHATADSPKILHTTADSLKINTSELPKLVRIHQTADSPVVAPLHTTADSPQVADKSKMSPDMKKASHRKRIKSKDSVKNGADTSIESADNTVVEGYGTEEDEPLLPSHAQQSVNNEESDEDFESKIPQNRIRQSQSLKTEDDENGQAAETKASRNVAIRGKVRTRGGYINTSGRIKILGKRNFMEGDYEIEVSPSESPNKAQRLDSDDSFSNKSPEAMDETDEVTETDSVQNKSPAKLSSIADKLMEKLKESEENYISADSPKIENSSETENKSTEESSSMPEVTADENDTTEAVAEKSDDVEEISDIKPPDQVSGNDDKETNTEDGKEKSEKNVDPVIIDDELNSGEVSSSEQSSSRKSSVESKEKSPSTKNDNKSVRLSRLSESKSKSRGHENEKSKESSKNNATKSSKENKEGALLNGKSPMFLKNALKERVSKLDRLVSSVESSINSKKQYNLESNTTSEYNSDESDTDNETQYEGMSESTSEGSVEEEIKNKKNKKVTSKNSNVTLVDVKSIMNGNSESHDSVKITNTSEKQAENKSKKTNKDSDKNNDKFTTVSKENKKNSQTNKQKAEDTEKQQTVQIDSSLETMEISSDESISLNKKRKETTDSVTEIQDESPPRKNESSLPKSKGNIVNADSSSDESIKIKVEEIELDDLEMNDLEEDDEDDDENMDDENEFFPALNLSRNTPSSANKKSHEEKLATPVALIGAIRKDRVKEDARKTFCENITKIIDGVAKGESVPEEKRMERQPPIKPELKVISVAEINNKRPVAEKPFPTFAKKIPFNPKQRARKTFPANNNKHVTISKFRPAPQSGNEKINTAFKTTLSTIQKDKHLNISKDRILNFEALPAKAKAEITTTKKTDTKDKMLVVSSSSTSAINSALNAISQSTANNIFTLIGSNINTAGGSQPKINLGGGSKMSICISQSALLGLTQNSNNPAGIFVVPAPTNDTPPIQPPPLQASRPSMPPITISSIQNPTQNSNNKDEETPEVPNSGLPILQPKPKIVNPLQTETSEGLPSTAGPTNQMLNRASTKLADYFRGVIKEVFGDASKEGYSDAKVKELELEIERLKHDHKKQLSMMEREMECLRVELEQQKRTELLELREHHEQERIRLVEEAKSKQWCAMCLKESQYRCCWNTSYCSYACQKSHWPQHQTQCQQGLENNASDNASTSDGTPNRSPLIKPVKQYTAGITKIKPSLNKGIVKNTTPRTTTISLVSSKQGGHSSSVPTLTFVQNTAGNIELVGDHGPIALGGKLITTSTLPTKIKGYIVSSSVTGSSPSTPKTVISQNASLLQTTLTQPSSPLAQQNSTSSQHSQNSQSEIQTSTVSASLPPVISTASTSTTDKEVETIDITM